jgi:hypothetical protein
MKSGATNIPPQKLKLLLRRRDVNHGYLLIGTVDPLTILFEDEFIDSSVVSVVDDRVLMGREKIVKRVDAIMMMLLLL